MEGLDQRQSIDVPMLVSDVEGQIDSILST